MNRDASATRGLFLVSLLCGACGAGSTAPVVVPACMGDLVVAGSAATWLRGSDGGIWAWGAGREFDSVDPHPVPQALTFPAVTDIVFKSDEICVRAASNEVRCGVFTADLIQGPVLATDAKGMAVAVPTTADAIQQACLIETAGSVWCWRSAPQALAVADGQEVAGLGGDVTALALQTSQGCALKADGTLWCWGTGYVGDDQEHLAPDVAQPPRAVSLEDSAVSIASEASSTCVALSDGSVSCFGLGAVGSATPTLAPTKLAIEGATRLTAGRAHTCALVGAGSVWCWGTNVSGQLGREPSGATAPAWLPPAPVAGLGDDISSLNAGYDHTCAIHADGTVSCWGDNTSGQCGVPVHVEKPFLSRPNRVLGCQSSQHK